MRRHARGRQRPTSLGNWLGFHRIRFVLFRLRSRKTLAGSASGDTRSPSSVDAANGGRWFQSSLFCCRLHLGIHSVARKRGACVHRWFGFRANTLIGDRSAVSCICCLKAWRRCGFLRESRDGNGNRRPDTDERISPARGSSVHRRAPRGC